MFRNLLFAVGMLVPTIVLAQDSRKFSAKSLESGYQLPVYPSRGQGVVGNEVIENTNDVDHLKTAVYSVRAELKKVLEFYTASLGTPKQTEGDQPGDLVYHFTKVDPSNARIRRKVIVHQGRQSKLVSITLYVKEYQSAADVDE